MSIKKNDTSTEKKVSESTLVDELFAKRIILFDKEVSEESCSERIGRIILLDIIKVKKPIIVLVNSYGGSLHCGLGLANVIEQTASTVITACIGVAESAASVILAAGHKRYAVADAEIMIHQHWSSYDESVKHTEMQIEAEASEKSFKQLLDFYVKKTKMGKAQTKKMLEKDSYMTAERALELGLIDEIGWNIHRWLK